MQPRLPPQVTEPDIRWITPVYGVTNGCRETHISFPEKARAKVREMVAELLGTTGLVALYVAEGTEGDWFAAGWGTAGQLGRVMGAVQLLDIPPGLQMESFPSYDLDNVTKRWPIGWPSRTIYGPPDPPEAYWPRLREHVEHLGRHFGSYVHQFVNGPFRLDPDMRARFFLAI